MGSNLTHQKIRDQSIRGRMRASSSSSDLEHKQRHITDTVNVLGSRDMWGEGRCVCGYECACGGMERSELK